MISAATARDTRHALSLLLLAGAGAALLSAAGLAAAIVLYRRTGIVLYPTLWLVNYSLRGLPLQPVALLVGSASLLGLWRARQRSARTWGVIAALGVVASALLLLFAANPYRPLASATVSRGVYHLALYRADARAPELYLLYACDPTGVLCRQVSGYAPFDRVSGRHLEGTPALAADAATGRVIVRIGGAVIGAYQPSGT